MNNHKVTDTSVFWLAVITPFILTYLLYYFGPVFLNTLNQMQFPIFVPKFDPIGIDLRWIWQIEQNWFEGGFVYPKNGAQHFPPFILILFIWCGTLNFHDAYRVFSLMTLCFYLATSIVIPYLVAKKNSKDKNVWLISIPFALFGLNTYGFQFEIERGQWNLIAVCFAIWGCYFYWQGSRYAKGFAIAFITLAIQLKIYPAIFFLALFAYRKNLKDGIETLLILAAINFALLFIFGWTGFTNFANSVVHLSKGTSYGVAQTSISAFLWLISQNFIDYLPVIKVFIVIYWLLIIITLCCLVNIIANHQEDFISLIVLLVIIGIIVPAHSNDYKLCLMPLILSIMSPQLITLATLRERYKKTIPIIFLMLFFGFSTLYSYATKPNNIFIQNNVLNLMIFSVCQCILVTFIFGTERLKVLKRNAVKLAVLIALVIVFFSVIQFKKSSRPINQFNGPVNINQIKNISLDVKLLSVNRLKLTANVIAKNNSSTKFNTVNTSGLPVRLSWRFVKVLPLGKRGQETTWDARKDLFWSIEAGTSDEIEITVDLPKESGNYLFEVTIVQDLVTFFHDAGMNIASIHVKVEN
jgi:hypothetical protein